MAFELGAGTFAFIFVEEGVVIVWEECEYFGALLAIELVRGFWIHF